jgi:E3 ubiquitin-protein ligase MARCH6
MVNNIVIDTLEGQLITLLVVVAFILVFLIREWVVQQGPNLNGGAELNVAIAAGHNAEIAAPEEPADQRREAPEGDGDAVPGNEGALAQAPRARMIARARQRRPRPQRQAPDQGVNQIAEATQGPETTDLGQGPSDAPTQMPSQNDPSDDRTSWPLYASSSQRLATEVRDTSDDLTSGALSANSIQRPSMPDRDTVARAAEIRRTIEEQSRLLRVQGSPIEVAEVFNELWNQSENEPMEVIRMVEEQGRGAELQGLIVAMRELEDKRHVEGRQEATRPQDGLDASSVVDQEDDPNYIRRSQSDDEEGFVLLDKPLTPSLEAEAGRSANVEGAMTPNDETAFYIATPTSSIDIETGASQPTTPPNTVFRDSSGHRSRSSTVEQEIVVSEVVHVTSVGADTPTVVTASSRDNPFHPDFAGDLPESSALVNVAASDDNSSNSPLASQPRGSHIDSSIMRAQENLADEKSDQSRTFIEIVEDWLWGGVALPPAPPMQAAGDDEQIVHDEAAEEPFVRVEHGQHARPPANDGGIAGQDAEVVAAAIQAGLDPNEVDAVDDIEDLEGILELVGMQGPLAGLIQNGMFCAVLVSLTIFFGVWIPYISGKAFLVILTHPVSLLLKLPLRWAASSADMIIDFFTFTIGCAFYWVDTIISLLCTPVAWMIPALARISQNKLLAGAAKGYAESALERLAKDFITTGNTIAGSDIPTFSLVAHESLRWLEACASWLLRITGDYCVHYFNLVYDNPGVTESVKLLAIGVADRLKILGTLVTGYARAMVVLAPTLVHINPLRVNLSIPQRTTPLDYELAHWDTKDRTLAIIFGYLLFAVLGVIYLDLSARIRGTNKAGRVEGGIADGLYQAGGVTKVVLIIGIEMIVFPLYCGLLLDVALLPLFGNATLMSRITFTMSSPNTSIFVHWFVGTCYMFHFALFVSMCRKILRTGVLCRFSATHGKKRLLTTSRLHS